MIAEAVISIVASTLGCFFSADLLIAWWVNRNNERSLRDSFEAGYCPPPKVEKDKLVRREAVISHLKDILKPGPRQCRYYLVVGEHGTGKTTAIMQSAREIGKGVIYVHAPPEPEEFADALAEAIGFRFEEYISYAKSLKLKLLSSSRTGKVIGNEEELHFCSPPNFVAEGHSKLRRVMRTLERGCTQYKDANGKPPVLVVDNINNLPKDMLEVLQDYAKYYADERMCILVFVGSEGTAPREMMGECFLLSIRFWLVLINPLIRH
jgi:hypothetical protein